ncbi:MAG: hypothetical protein HYS98_07440 [Deltaproteobacteria bacterium]|nr:hypothetical protein [Deltaproteobacteria bacterium]
MNQKKSRKEYVYALFLFFIVFGSLKLLRPSDPKNAVVIRKPASIRVQKPVVFLRDINNTARVQTVIAKRHTIPLMKGNIDPSGSALRVMEETLPPQPRLRRTSRMTGHETRLIAEQEKMDLCKTLFESKDDLPKNQYQRMMQSLNCVDSHPSTTTTYRTGQLIENKNISNLEILRSTEFIRSYREGPGLRRTHDDRIRPLDDRQSTIIGRKAQIINDKKEYEKFSKDLKIIIDECSEKENIDSSIASSTLLGITEENLTATQKNQNKNLEMYLIRTGDGEVYLFIFTQTTNLIYKFDGSGIKDNFSAVTRIETIDSKEDDDDAVSCMIHQVSLQFSGESLHL